MNIRVVVVVAVVAAAVAAAVLVGLLVAVVVKLKCRYFSRHNLIISKPDLVSPLRGTIYVDELFFTFRWPCNSVTCRGMK